MPERPPLLTRGFLFLTLAHFLQALGFSSLLLLPLYLEHLGGSRAEIGTLMALSGVGGLLSRPFAAWALDRWGRKPTVLVATAFVVAGMLTLRWVDDLGPLIYVDRIVFGIGGGTLFAGYFTWASDLIPAERRTEGIALFGVSGLAPIGLNAFVHDLAITPPDLSNWFSMLSGLIACSAILVLAVPDDSQRTRPSSGADGDAGWSLRRVARELFTRELWPVWVVSCVFAGLIGVFMTFATVVSGNRGVINPAALWGSYTVGAIGIRLLGATVFDRVGPRNLVAPALASYAGAFVLMIAASDANTFLLAGFLAGLGHGTCFPIVVSQVVDRAPDAIRGSALSMFTALWQLSEMILPPLAGLLSDRRGDGSMLAISAVAGVVGLACWAALEHAVAKSAPRGEAESG